MSIQMARMVARTALVERIEAISAEHRAVDTEFEILWEAFEWYIPKIHEARIRQHSEQNRLARRAVARVIHAGTWPGLPNL